MDGWAWGLVAVFGALAAGDWLAVHTGSKRLEYVCKPGCMVALVAAATVLDPVDGGARAALVAALVLSAVGDVFLMLPRERWFVHGLASFLLGHLAFIAAFWLEGVEAPGIAAGAVAAAVLVASVGRRVVTAARTGGEPALAGPVAAYVVVIALMVLSAIATADPRAVAGAVLFAGSDSLIAWQRFIRPRPWMPLTIIVTYHAAQLLLTLSFT